MKKGTDEEEKVVLGNKITAGDFEIYSQKTDIHELEKILDRIITKHKEFIDYSNKRNFWENHIG